jgi:glycosyltransferase involved in cell wall biosynthesis
VVELSVIIPTYNRAEMLQRCLQALSCQTQPVSDFEVIVVVDGSSDATAEMLGRLATPFHLQVFSQANRGQPAALNRGWNAARGHYCLFLDDDIIADRHLLVEHVRVQRELGGVIGLGHLTRQLPPKPNGLARYLAAWGSQHHAHLHTGARAPFFIDCFSGNLSVPRSSLLRTGGFAEDLRRSFDIELGYRLQAEGMSFAYIPTAIGHQDYRKTFHQIASDFERAGEAGLELWRRHSPLGSETEISRFNDVSRKALLLRRTLLALRAPASALALVSRLLDRSPWALGWYHFLYSYYYWRGVRRTVSRDAWRSLTRG